MKVSSFFNVLLFPLFRLVRMVMGPIAPLRQAAVEPFLSTWGEPLSRLRLGIHDRKAKSSFMVILQAAEAPAIPPTILLQKLLSAQRV